jgi:ABC-type glycerol-3-phosphate transport system substrate-binding protein
MLTAARIGILANGKSPEAACDFVKMVLSPEGQRLLLRPEIARIPIDSEARTEALALPDRVQDALRLEWISYDSSVSARRYWAVNTLFDIMITESLAERKSLWARVRALEGQVDPAALSSIHADLTSAVTV